MTALVLANPDAPLASAQALLNTSKVSKRLRSLVAPALARWLVARPENLRPVTSLEPGASESVVQAYERGELQEFRRRKTVTEQAQNILKWLARAEEHERHPDAQVRRTATKALSGLRSNRATFDQVADALRAMRSALARSGGRRAQQEPVGPVETIPAASQREWRSVTTQERLLAAGRELGGNCFSSRSSAADYMRGLRSGEKAFWELIAPDNQVLGLVAFEVDEDGLVVSEAKGPGNELLASHRVSLKRLLKATGAQVGGCRDLVSLGLADGFLDVDRERPNLEVAGLRLWSDEGGSILIENDGNWGVLQKVDEGVFLGRGDHDAENLLGTVLQYLLQK